MSLDLSWFKTTGLGAVQAAAHTALAGLGVSAVDVLHLDWEQIGSLSVGAALVSFLGSVVAYKLPNGPAQVVSAAAALTVADADEARKT